MIIKKAAVCLTAVMLMLSLNGCFLNKTQSYISDELGINAQCGKVVVESNNHGGFHGDGTTFIKLTFSNDDCLNSIKNNAEREWSVLPLNDTIKALLNITKALFEDSIALPSVEHGYYCFIDRHPENTDPNNYRDVLKRASINITLCIYDVDTQSLYYIKIDT